MPKKHLPSDRLFESEREFQKELNEGKWVLSGTYRCAPIYTRVEKEEEN